MAETTYSPRRRVASISSALGTTANMNLSPTVVVPPASYMASTIPETLAKARAHADTIIDDETSSDDESAASFKSVVPNYAFAFDIDGVLLKGGHVIPEAKEAMQYLNGNNPDGIKVPYIFVTNVSFQPHVSTKRDSDFGAIRAVARLNKSAASI
jgi:hypothetical protein